jgi:flagellar biosynthesis GTPase FlhF
VYPENHNALLLRRHRDSSRDLTSSKIQEVQDSIGKIHEHLRQRQQSIDQRDSMSTLTAASIAALDRVSASLKSSEPVDINEHFNIPQPVDSNYVGREDKAERLAEIFFSHVQGQPEEQRRFVIYGVGGSGKTQFCCKFAQDHQQRYVQKESSDPPSLT